MSLHFQYHTLILLCLFCFRAGCFERGASVSGLKQAAEPHAQLVLIRHGESVSNRDRLFSWPGVELTEKGKAEASRAGKLIQDRGFQFKYAFTSGFTRAQQSMDTILRVLGRQDLQPKKAEQLNTREFGEVAGKTVEEARAIYGSKIVDSWLEVEYGKNEVVPPGGQPLEFCDERAQKYYREQIAPLLREGQNVLVVASRNPVISVMKAIEGNKMKPLKEGEKSNALPIVYDLDSNGKVMKRELLRP